MKRRAPTIIFAVAGTLFSLMWVLFISGLVVLTAPPSQPPVIHATPKGSQEPAPSTDATPSRDDSAEGSEDRVLTFLDVYTWHVLAAQVVLGVGAIILIFKIARRRVAPRWWLPIICTAVACILWIAILMLVSMAAEPPFARSGLALESTGRILGVVLTAATLFAVLIHFRVPPRTAGSSSPTDPDAEG